MKICNGNSDINIFSKQMQSIREKYSIFIKIYRFYQKEKNLFAVWKIKRYVIHIRDLNHGLILKRVHRVIQFSQKAWLKQYINIKTKLRKEAKNEFEKDFFKLMNDSVFDKTMENVRNHRYIQLVTKE